MDDNNTAANTTASSQTTNEVARIMAILQVIVMILIISGNTLVLLAYNKFRHLQTVTGKFVANLAISDLVLGLTLPLQIAFFFFPAMETMKFVCITRFQVITFTTTVSLVSLFCTVQDRFIAILMPLRYHMVMSDKVAYILIVSSWVYSFILTSLPFFGFNSWATAPFCMYEMVFLGSYRFILALQTIILSVIMFVIYLKIFHVAYKHYRRIRAEELVVPNASQMHQDSKLAKVMALVVLSFSLSWLPFCIIQIQQVYDFSLAKAIAGNFAVFLAITNSATNPLIYAWKNNEYRKAFLALLCCRNNAVNEDSTVYTLEHNAIHALQSGGNRNGERS